MIALASFLPYVLPFAAHCAEPVATRAVLDAAIDFCEQTGVVQSTLAPVSTVANVFSYNLVLPADQDLVSIKRAWFKGTSLAPVPTDAVGAPEAWRVSVPGVTPATGDPRAFYEAQRNAIGLYPRPSASETDVLTVRVSTKPQRVATQLADELFYDWVEVVAAGALERLHSTPGVSYTDQGRADRRREEFLVGINKAKLRAATGRTPGELSVTPRPFA